MVRFAFERQPSWPPLAWLAECRPGRLAVRVLHGPGVEVADEWFCEAIWDGPFAGGDFDRTDLIFGSGARLRDGRLTFVSSGTTVDRLHVLERDGVLRVSNSLPCLLAAVGASADPAHPRYIRDLQSVIKGLRQYERTLPTTVGPVRLVYFANLVWDGTALTEIDKPNGDRRFESFEAYHAFLDGGVGACLANAQDAARRRPFRPIGTLSSGYDSPTVATLARRHGLREVIAFADARHGWLEDSRPIAAVLGLEVRLLARDAWRAQPLAEVPFLAADGRGEDVFFAAAAAHLSGRVLLTGFHGDKIWDKHTAAAALTPHIKRGDPSGTTLTEYRLWHGFIHFPVPFMGVRAIADVHAISNSAEMAPWDPPGESRRYSRPICRRIVESAGVPRTAFGVSKKAASVLFNADDSRYLEATRADHARWAESTRGAWLLRGRLAPHVVDRSLEAIVRRYSAGVDAAIAASRLGARVWRAPFAWLEMRAHKQRFRFPELLRMNLMYRSIFPWAVERAKQRYALGAQSASAPPVVSVASVAQDTDPRPQRTAADTARQRAPRS